MSRLLGSGPAVRGALEPTLIAELKGERLTGVLPPLDAQPRIAIQADQFELAVGRV
jgi:hypothetical protein